MTLLDFSLPHDADASPTQLLQHAISMLQEPNGEMTEDPARVRIARSLILEARINLVLQAWRPTHHLGKRE